MKPENDVLTRWRRLIAQLTIKLDSGEKLPELMLDTVVMDDYMRRLELEHENAKRQIELLQLEVQHLSRINGGGMFN